MDLIDPSIGLPWWLILGKEPACSAGSIPGLRRSPAERNGNPLQYSCLENSKERGAWWVIVHEVTNESDMIERLTHTVGYTH